jgi:hypothetical protein
MGKYLLLSMDGSCHLSAKSAGKGEGHINYVEYNFLVCLVVFQIMKGKLMNA